MNKILVIGSLNMDLSINTPRIPEIGETIAGIGFKTSPGGKGANQAVAVARLGGQATMVGCVGDDLYGRDLLNSLSEDGVDVSNIKVFNHVHTGIAVIVVKDGNNFIILDSGANFYNKPGHIEEIEGIIRKNDIVLLQLEVPFEVVEKSVEIAKRNGIKVLLNPAPACSLSDELLSGIDIFTPNEIECEQITGMPLKSIDNAKQAVKCLLSKGIRQIVITMGSRGVVYNRGTDIVHKNVPKVNVIDTTAAGDSFSAALAVKLSNGKPIDEAIDFAIVVSTITVTRKGAQTSLPLLNEVINQAEFCENLQEDMR